MEKRKKYVAYGSNLNVEQMIQRCPTAKVVGQGVIPDHELLFRGYKSGAVATVEPKQGENVPVLIWDIGQEDEYYLDRYEGYPRLYGKQDITVQTESGTEQIMVYTMTEGHEIGCPSGSYLNTIATGYLEAGFDMNYLLDSVEKCKAIVEEKDALEFAAYRRGHRHSQAGGLRTGANFYAGASGRFSGDNHSNQMESDLETTEKENTESADMDSLEETEQEECSWQIQQP